MIARNRTSRRIAAVAAAAAAAATALASPGTAAAATVTFTNTSVQWLDPAGESVGRGLIVTEGGGTPDATIAWGQPVGRGEQSSFNFLTAGDPLIATPGGAFTLGTFTHANNPTYYGLTGVTLRIAADIAVDGVAVGSRLFDYVLTLDETPNEPPCIYGGANGQCNDRVSIATGPASQTFDVEGRAYTLAFGAFQVSGVESDSFISPELGSNQAQLRALVTAAGVPEPASWALLILGFGAVAGALRRPAARRALAAGERR